MSAPLQNIGAVQSRRMHPYAHPICSRRRRRVHLLHTDSVDPTMRCDDDCTHQPGYSSLAWIQTRGVEAGCLSRRIFSGTFAVEALAGRGTKLRWFAPLP